LLSALAACTCATAPPEPAAPPPAHASKPDRARPDQARPDQPKLDQPCKQPPGRGGVTGGVLKMLRGRRVVPADPARMASTVLQEVKLVHTTLGQGGQSDGFVRFAAPAGDHDLYLDARSPVEGYAFKTRIGRARTGLSTFSVSCLEARPRHTVAWSFTLVDGEGNRSNSIDVPVVCTGQPVPGTAPRLEGVDLDATDLPLSGKTAARVRLQGTHPPFRIRAAVEARGNGWKMWSDQDEWKQESFSVACQRPSPHLVQLRFRVIDTYGRVSNVVEKSLNCGGCQ
jgi:hypothetical protein